MVEYIIISYIALLLTVLTEVVAALLLGVRSKNGLMHIVLINCVTNPLLNLLLAFAFSLIANKFVFIVIVLLMEAAVVFTEAVYYRKMLEPSRRTPLFMSFVLNGASFVLGLAAYFLLFALR